MKTLQTVAETELLITYTGFICGYATSQYFAKIVQRYAQMTPTEYRTNPQTHDTINQVKK